MSHQAILLPGIVLPGRLAVTADALGAVDGADLVVLAVPSQTLRDNLKAWAPALPWAVIGSSGSKDWTGLRA